MPFAEIPTPFQDEPEPETPDASVGLLIGVVGLCSFASTVSMRLIDPLVPLIASGFDRGLTEVAMLMPVFTLSYALGQPFIGPVADSFGKVRVIAVSLAILAVFQLAGAFAPNFETLALLRGLSGIAAGGIIPVAMAAIADRVTMVDRQVALSRLLSAMVMGQVTGSLMAGLVGDYAGWRIAFIAPAVISAAASLMAFVLLKPRANARRNPLDPASVLERYRGVLSNPQAGRLLCLVLFEGVGVFAIFPFMAELLQRRGAIGSSEAGIAIAVFGLGGLLYTLIAKWLLANLGTTRMCQIGGSILAGVLIALTLPLPRWSAPLLLGLMGLGYYLIHSTYQTQATELSTSARSSAMALFACCLFMGTALGPIAMAFLRQWLELESAILLYAAIVAVLGFVSGPVLGLKTAYRPR